jgi:hypothetical protein
MKDQRAILELKVRSTEHWTFLQACSTFHIPTLYSFLSYR